MTALKVEVRVMFSVVRRIKAFGRCPEIKNRVITRRRRLMNYTMMMLIPIIDCVILKILKTLSKSLVTLRLIKGSRTRRGFPLRSCFKEILSSFIPVVHASSFPILIRISGRLTTALLLMWDITFPEDAIAVSRDDRLMVSV